MRSEVLRPTDRVRELNVVLVLWSLGVLVLNEHAERLLGADVTGAPEHRARYVRVASEALRGLLTEEAYEHGQRVLVDGQRGKGDTDG